MKVFQGMIIAFSMYSKIPMPRIEWNKENMRFPMCFFPLVGAVIGALILGWYYLSAAAGVGNTLRSIVFVLIPIIITGGIHMDGYLDTIDALSSYQTMEKRLDILKDSNSGAFAIIYGLVYIVLLIGIWSEIIRLVPSTFTDAGIDAIWVLSVGYIYSRALSGLGITSLKCAKNSGLAATFSSMSDKNTAGIILGIIALFAAVSMVYINIALGIAAVAAGVIMFVIYRCVSYMKFGGITGDLAGFFLQMCELMMAAAVLIVLYVLKVNK